MTQRKDPAPAVRLAAILAWENGGPKHNKVMRGFIFKFIHQARSLECVDFVEAYTLLDAACDFYSRFPAARHVRVRARE